MSLTVLQSVFKITVFTQVLAGEIQKELRHRAYEEGFRSATSSSFFRTRKATRGNRKGIAASFWGRRKGSTLGTARFPVRVDERAAVIQPSGLPCLSWELAQNSQTAEGVRFSVWPCLLDWLQQQEVHT